jgi:pimeloyl-ACP methyl ester carboxylesterase
MDDRVDSLERFDFGGPAQWALVRGRSRALPVLLLVQEGPGFPMIHDAQAIEQRIRLEEPFRVVYWDQRGTGKSFSARDRGPLAVDTLVGDVRAMVRALCERLGVATIDVVGFSLGGSLALLACAEEGLPVRSLTMVGPDIDLLEAERSAYAFALAEAERRGHKGALRALRAIGAPPHAEPDRFMNRVKWVANFGGVHRGKDYAALAKGTLLALWRSPHYKVREMIGALRGMGATQERALPGLQGFNLLATPLHVPVPVAVFQGRHDPVAPPALAETLAGRLGARLVWFEDSAHRPYEEESGRFREELLRFVRGVGTS